jgi:hypothetical protein
VLRERISRFYAVRVTDPHHHEFGGVLLTNQACPDGPIVGHNPACPYCAGTAVVTLDMLSRWQHHQDQAEQCAAATV